MDVKYVAELARIKLSPFQINKLEKQFHDILKHFKNLEEVDTKDVEPCAHAIPQKNIFREDKIGRSLRKKEVLKNSPDKEKDFFKVPRLIK